MKQQNVFQQREVVWTPSLALEGPSYIPRPEVMRRGNCGMWVTEQRQDPERTIIQGLRGSDEE